jgi:acyl carrier protein
MQEYIAQIEELTSIPPKMGGGMGSPLGMGGVGGQILYNGVSPASNINFESTLRQLASEICHNTITAEDMNKDLEADLGLDSLDRIRIVTRLHKENGKCDRNALLNARTLQEMLVTATS